LTCSVVCGVWREKKESDVHLGVRVEQVPLFDIAEKKVTAGPQPQLVFASGVVILRKRRFGYTRGVLGFTFFTG